MNPQGRVALVTGGARRLGRSIALALAARGAKVVIHYHRSEDDARKTVEAIVRAGGQAVAVCADQSSEAAVRQAVAEAAERMGPVDILVNNAAIFERTPLLESDIEAWDRHLNVNLRGPFLFARAVAPGMRERGAGRIVNMVDIAAERPWPGYLAYSVSKAGLVALTRGLARALAPEIQVNAVAPGIILPPETWDDDEIQGLLGRVPMRRAGLADEIAQTVVFLVEGPDYITGAVIPVDGGQSTM